MSSPIDAVGWSPPEALLAPGEPVLVAVSGGVDSMVLLHMLRTAGHPCTVVHVDHGLRGAESDADRELVVAHCATLRVPCTVHRVDVRAAMAGTDRSVQMAARAERYAVLGGEAQRTGLKVALAHHRDDAVESLLLGLLRGPGAAGWAGMPVRSGVFVRPILAYDRAWVLDQAQRYGIPFREDASNADPKYLRNRVRHELLPMMEDLRPGATRVMGRSLRLAAELQALGARAVAGAMAELHADGDAESLPFPALYAHGAPNLVLHAWLSPKGFHPEVQEQVLHAVERARTGAVFLAGRYSLYVDRAQLLCRVDPPSIGTWTTDDPAHWPMDAPVELFHENPGIGRDPWVLALGEDRPAGPYTLRPWQKGDRMRPSGMGGSRAISDMLVDAKLPRWAKQNVMVLLAGDEVVWLVGFRVAERVRVTPMAGRAIYLRVRPRGGKG